MEKEALLGKTLEELKTLAKEMGLRAFVGEQIAYWLYKTNITTFDEMRNISKTVRAQLAERFVMGHQLPVSVHESKDGTKKYLFKTHQNKFIEVAYIPDGKRKTLCVSSQVGCKMGCLFCMTGKQGFQAHLSAGEIINQVRSIPEGLEITNIVYMGMGEPFDNLEQVLKSTQILTADYGFDLSVRKITVSTIGVIPGMKHFLENSKCHLAVSLHSPFDEERRKLMPIQNVYPMKEVIEEIRRNDLGKYRRVSFEYIVFKGLNDSPAHVKELARILNGLRCRINLIAFHPIPDSPLRGASNDEMQAFQQQLEAKGLLTTIRRSRGLDIQAACGLLSTKELVKKQQSRDF